MASTVLTPERVLDAAEDVLRRYGPAKATVVDVAGELDVSHGSVYRHFESKAALRDAVAARWLARVSEPLGDLADRPGPAIERLRTWLDALVEWKQSQARSDPELFATYVSIAGESRKVITDHVEALIGQLESVLAQGVESGELSGIDPRESARAVFDATARFHNPVNAAQWSDPSISREYEAVRELVLSGLSGPMPAGRARANAG